MARPKLLVKLFLSSFAKLFLISFKSKHSDQGLEGTQHFEMNIQPDHNDFTSQHVHQQSARLSQRIPPTSNVRASTAAVKKREYSDCSY